MTQEEKQLLLKDIWARLPYGEVICGTKSSSYKPTFYATIGNPTYLLRYIEHDELKPYLRPMSSMTEEERKELSYYENSVQITDFYYSHHIDCRFMIEKGLALEAKEGMYES